LKFGGTATKAYPHHTPAGKAMYQILGVFAEFERAIIIERVKSGLARARSQGKRLGRRPVSTDVVERIRGQLATGTGILKYGKALRVGTGMVHRLKSISARPRGCEGWFSAAPLLVTGRRPAKNSRIPEPLAMHRLASHGRKPQGFSATASAELGIPRKR
jgi:hypothetical protein